MVPCGSNSAAQFRSRTLAHQIIAKVSSLTRFAESISGSKITLDWDLSPGLLAAVRLLDQCALRDFHLNSCKS